MSDFDGKFNYPDTTPYERRLYALNKELQKRIDKAIEYIEEHSWGLEKETYKKINELESILKGSDSNE